MPKKFPAKETTIAFILDKSSSMASCREATISGFNEYVATLLADKKSKYSMSLTLFDTGVETRYTNLPLKNVPELDAQSYMPSGMTALYDAVGMTIESTEKGLLDNQKVLCVIMTDGEENSSKEYTTTRLAEKIKELEKKGWSFVFLGANQDAWATGRQFGFSQNNVANYNSTEKGTQKVFRSVANNTAFYAASAEVNTVNFFSAQDKDDLENTK